MDGARLLRSTVAKSSLIQYIRILSRKLYLQIAAMASLGSDRESLHYWNLLCNYWSLQTRSYRKTSDHGFIRIENLCTTGTYFAITGESRQDHIEKPVTWEYPAETSLNDTLPDATPSTGMIPWPPG